MQSQVWVVPLVFFKAHNCANDTFRMEKIVCMNQYCSMPPRLFKYLQLVHAIYSSPWFPPSTHPLLSLVDTNLGQLLSCSSLLYNRRRGPQKLSRCLLMAFVMIVSWISTTFGELLNWLASLGALLELLPTLIGLTALKIGNFSEGSDCCYGSRQIRSAGMSMADYFARAMFNVPVGLQTALVIQTFSFCPNSYEL